MTKIVEMGQAFKANGLKGAFFINLFNEKDSILKPGMKVSLRSLRDGSETNSFLEKKIESVRLHKKCVIKLEDVNSREEIESLLPFSLGVDRSSFPALENDNEFYLTDLVNLDVYCSKTDKLLGKVDHFYENGAQAVLSISKLSGELVDLPFVDHFFPIVDLKEKKVFMLEPDVI